VEHLGERSNKLHPPDTPPHVRGAQSNAASRVVVCLLLLVHAGLLAWGAYRHSPTIDEVRWLPAGLVHLLEGRFDVARANPPLVRIVAALPVLAAEPELRHPDGRAAHLYREFVEINGARSAWLFTLGRWACIPISMIGGYICFRWARELYGIAAGFVALSLWCFSPNILAHSQIVAHDAPAASFLVAAGYLLWRWLRQPSWWTALGAGVMLGLAELTKMSLIICFGIWPVVWLGWRWTRPERSTNAVPGIGQMVLILALGLYVLNLGYGFEGTFRKLGDYVFVSGSLSGMDGGRGNRFDNTWLGELPLPLPADYVLGIDQVKGDFEGQIVYAATYLRGEWRQQGLWYYFVYALAVKGPLGTWILLALSLAVRAFKLDGLKRARDEAVLLVPALSLLILASSQTKFTDHLRYVLPILPFAFVWISRIGNVVQTCRPIWALSTSAALAWSIGSSLSVYPHSLSYFNELVGGPKGGHYHLVSSNIDYGQDLLYLREWIEAHAEARPLHLAYWNQNTFDPAILGIDYVEPVSGPAPGDVPPYDKLEKLGPQPGWHAANVNVLRGDDWPGRSRYADFGYYSYLLNFEPVGMAGYSIYIYHITIDDANRVRKQMNLPLISRELPAGERVGALGRGTSLPL
jgi:4-amino-4-deoxy-L-arabinose transferase-like glycosyltransferase